LREIAQALREALQGLRQSADTLRAASDDLGRTTKEQEEFLSHQAAALQETQVTAQEIKQTSVLAAQKADLDGGNSGTTMRLLAGILAAAPAPALACSLCAGNPAQTQTLRQDAARARLVLYGRLANPRLNSDGNGPATGGSTDFHIAAVLKADPFLGSQKVIALPRYVPVDPKERAMLDFAVKLTESSASCTLVSAWIVWLLAGPKTVSPVKFVLMVLSA